MTSVFGLPRGVGSVSATVCMGRVARFGLFEAKKQNCPFFKLVGFVIFDNLLSSWPFLSLQKFIILKSKIFLFLKQSLAFFSFKHLATLCMGVRA